MPSTAKAGLWLSVVTADSATTAIRCRRWLTFEYRGSAVVVLARVRTLFWRIERMGPEPTAMDCVRVVFGGDPGEERPDRDS